MFKLSLAQLGLVDFGNGKWISVQQLHIKQIPIHSPSCLPVCNSDNAHHAKVACEVSCLQVWHHPSILLKQLRCSKARAWFWCKCSPAAVTVYSVTVWRVDLIREGRNVTSHPKPWPYAVTVGALSDWSVWYVIISRSQTGAAKHGQDGKAEQKESKNEMFESMIAAQLCKLLVVKSPSNQAPKICEQYTENNAQCLAIVTEQPIQLQNGQLSN